MFTGGLSFNKGKRQEAWRNYDPSAPWSKTNKAWQIEKGLIKTDPNKTPLGRTWELISRFTWQAPQTMIGWHTSGAYNFVGGVESVQHANGATVIESKKDNWGAFTLGNFIIGENGIHAGFEDHLFVHEYGHYLQSQKWGVFYLPAIGIPSIQSAALDGGSIIDIGDHRERWFEAGASRNAGEYFDEFYGSGLDSYVKGSPDYFDLTSFINYGTNSPYVNPNAQHWNRWGHPIHGKFHWSDPFLYAYLLSFLFGL